MKLRFLHKVVVLAVLFTASVSYGQLQPFFEDNNLKFQEHFFEALKQKAIQNYDKAIESLEKCYEIDQNNMAVEFEFSKNYLALKQFQEALLFIDKALKKEPQNIYLLQQKEAIYKAQQHISEAIAIQKEIVKINPKLNDELVLLYIQNQQFNEAETLIYQIETMALSTTRTKSYKQYLLDRKNIKFVAKEENVDDDEVSLRDEFNQTQQYTTVQKLLNLEVQNKNFEELYADSKQALELFPAQAFLYQMNGLALNELRKYKEALAVLMVGIDFVIENKLLEAAFYEELAKSYRGLNNNAEALKFEEKAKELRKEK